MSIVRIDRWINFEHMALDAMASAHEVYIGTYRLNFWGDSIYLDTLKDCKAGSFELIVGHQPNEVEEATNELSALLRWLPPGAKTRLLPRFHAKYIVTLGPSDRRAFFGSANFGDSASQNLACMTTRRLDVEHIMKFHKQAWGWRPPTVGQINEILRQGLPPCE